MPSSAVTGNKRTNHTRLIMRNRSSLFVKLYSIITKHIFFLFRTTFFCPVELCRSPQIVVKKFGRGAKKFGKHWSRLTYSVANSSNTSRIIDRPYWYYYWKTGRIYLVWLVNAGGKLPKLVLVDWWRKRIRMDRLYVQTWSLCCLLSDISTH
jgi:hypothetical protein